MAHFLNNLRSVELAVPLSVAYDMTYPEFFRPLHFFAPSLQAISILDPTQLPTDPDDLHYLGRFSLLTRLTLSLGAHFVGLDQQKADSLWQSWKALTALESLEIPIIHDQVCNLTRLTSLRTLPPDHVDEIHFSFRSLAPLTRLVHLEFNGTELPYWGRHWAAADLGALANLQRLETLSLASLSPDKEEDLLLALSCLPALRSVDLRSAPLSALPPLLFDKSSQSLFSVQISHCKTLSRIEALETLPLVTKLEFFPRQITQSVIDSICRSHQLEELRWPFAEGIPEIAAALGPVGRLKSLALADPGGDDHINSEMLASVSKLTSLTFLDVHSRLVTAQDFSPLTVLTRLQTLQLYCGGLRSDNVRKILPNVKVES